MKFAARKLTGVMVLAAAVAVPVCTADDQSLQEWPVGADGRPIIFGEFDNRLNDRALVSTPVTQTSNLDLPAGGHESRDRCEVKVDVAGGYLASVMGEIDAARTNGNLLLDQAATRVEAVQPTTWRLEPNVDQVQVALKNELARIKSIEAPADSEASKALLDAVAAIEAARKSLEKAREE